MTKRNRSISLLLAATVFFVMIFAAFCISPEAGHDCMGEGCAICRLTGIYEKIQRTLAPALTAFAIASLLVCAFVHCVSLCHKTRTTDTLITLKVQLMH